MARKSKGGPLRKQKKSKGVKKSPKAARNSIAKHHPFKLRRSRREREVKKSLINCFINSREVKYAKGGTGNARNIQIICDSPDKDDTPNETVKQQTNSNTAKTLVNSNSSNRNNRTLNDMFITLDAAYDEANNDVIEINDYDDSDVIFVSERCGVSSKCKCNSVILIDDDSISDVVITSDTNEKQDTIPRKENNKQTIINQSNLITINTQATTTTTNSNLIECLPVSPIGNKINPEPSQYYGLATSTPNPTLTQASYIASSLLYNLATLQVSEHYSSRSIPSPKKIKTGILTDQIKQISSNPTSNITTYGSNFLNAGPIRTNGLRPIFIDGSNVAIGHSNGKYFSVEGLKICIDYFKIRGHEVTALVPMFRKKFNQSTNAKLLFQLEKEGTAIFTPSRTVNGRHIVPYDDRYIVLLAHVYKGVIVSSDNYRDLLQEDPSLLETIENRILSPTWVKDMIIFPADPMGRDGPKLDEFLRFP